VSEYIDAEGGGYFYKMLAKKMKADVEYKLVKPSVYEATFYLNFAPPMKFPMRFDQPYQYKSPAGSEVQSVAKYRSMLDDIFVNTKVKIQEFWILFENFRAKIIFLFTL